MAFMAGFDPLAPWLVATLRSTSSRFVRLPVVWLQMRAAVLPARRPPRAPRCRPRYHAMMRVWFWLGWPAFLALVAVSG